MTELIADGLLLCGTLLATMYCFVLSRKVKKLSGFESGIGGAIAVLSKQVDDMQSALKKTEQSASEASKQLQEILDDANAAAGRLEVLLAGMDDFADQQVAQVISPKEPQVEPGAFSTARMRG